jgi:hypothetical protein
MSEANQPPSDRTLTPVALGELRDELRLLREELAGLRSDVAAEVRTRRLVVVDSQGFERLVAEGGDDHGFLAVRGRAGERRCTAVELYVNDPVDGDGTHAGVALGEDGDIVAALEVTGHGEPTLWLRGADDV